MKKTTQPPTVDQGDSCRIIYRGVHTSYEYLGSKHDFFSNLAYVHQYMPNGHICGLIRDVRQEPP